MAWDGKKLPDGLASAATSAANAAGNGAKNAAYLTHIQTAIGSNYKRQLFRDEVRVWEATASGTLPISGSTFVLPQVATQDTISTADIDTGEWVHYIVKAADASSSVPTQNYIATNVTKTGGDGPGFLTDDTAGGGTVVLGAFVLTSASFDTTASDPNSLASAYATCMTLQNDFPPGNSGGSSDFDNSTWPVSSDFGASPYGANVDPIKSGQSEPGVGMTDAGYIVQRRAASGRSGTSFGLWQWVMGPKGVLVTETGWRVQVRDVQAALKIDSLSNDWRSKFSGQIQSYGLNGLGGLRVSGLLDNFSNTNGRPLFLWSTNPVEARAEASGGISFKSFGESTDRFQVELNSNDPLVALAADETPDRVVAFAAMYWARLIADDGGSIPSELQMGAMHGVDFFDGSGRVGTPGQSRLVRLTDQWKPIVVGYVLQGSPPSQPMTPANAGAWMAANPPPFV